MGCLWLPCWACRQGLLLAPLGVRARARLGGRVLTGGHPLDRGQGGLWLLSLSERSLFPSLSMYLF